MVEVIKKSGMDFVTWKQTTCLINHAQLYNEETEMKKTLDWTADFQAVERFGFAQRTYWSMILFIEECIIKKTENHYWESLRVIYLLPLSLMMKWTCTAMNCRCFIIYLFYAKINAGKAPKNEKVGFSVGGIYTGLIYYRNEN